MRAGCQLCFCCHLTCAGCLGCLQAGPDDVTGKRWHRVVPYVLMRATTHGIITTHDIVQIHDRCSHEPVACPCVDWPF